MAIKKIITSIACGLFLTVGATSAHASLLTDWTYELTNTSLKNFNTDFVNVGSASNGKDNMSFTTGSYNTTVSPNGEFNGTFNFSEDKLSASTSQDKYLEQVSSTVEESIQATNTPATKLADLTFTYSVASVEQPQLKMNVTYTIPLYTYYDPSTSTSFVYYNNSEVSSMGALALTFDDYKYGVTGIGLFVDNRALVALPGADGDTNLYTGWAINSDTIANNYEEYVVGGDSNVSIGAKDTPGLFNITGIFSMVATPVKQDPAPTPEPATLILSGIGLAGLGALKRRRNKAA